MVAVGGHGGRGRGDWGVILPPLTDWLQVTRRVGAAESRRGLGGSGVGGREHGGGGALSWARAGFPRRPGRPESFLAKAELAVLGIRELGIVISPARHCTVAQLISPAKHCTDSDFNEERASQAWAPRKTIFLGQLFSTFFNVFVVFQRHCIFKNNN